MPLKATAAIVGVGEHPSGMFSNESALSLMMRAIREAIRNSRVSKDDIDAIILEPCLADQRFNTDIVWSRMVEELGLGGKCNANFQIHSGGSTGFYSLLSAAGLINSDLASTVLIAHADKLGTGMSVSDAARIFSTVGIYEEWEQIYGLNYNTIGALITQRYMYETGTRIEEIASVIVALRKWAALNPNALLRRTLTVDEVLRAKVVSSPLTSRMCNIVCDSAYAYVVTSRKRAEELVGHPVYLLSAAGNVTHFSLMKADLAAFGWRKSGEKAFGMAGVKPGDIDIVELYDSYPVLPLIQLDQLGFCESGESGKFVYDGNTWPGGTLPMTTDGGSLCRGHSGAAGGAHIVEAARQLLRQAGERQVRHAKYALATNIGGQYMDSQVMIFGSEIP